MFVQSSPREKRGESYPREFTRLSQLNPNQLWRELERMSFFAVVGVQELRSSGEQVTKEELLTSCVLATLAVLERRHLFFFHWGQSIY